MSNSWHKQHASALFLGVLLTVSVILLTGGFYLQQHSKPIVKVAGNLLIQLSGTALAASVATAFLGFSDIRDSLAATLAKLFSEGEIVDLLSDEAKSTIGKQIALRRLETPARTLEPSLYSHILQISDSCLGMAHIHNYNIRDSLLDHPTRPDLLLRKVAISFRVVTRHLEDPISPFPYRFFYQIPVSHLRDIDKDDFVLDFDATLGERPLSRDDLDVKTVNTGGADFLRFELDQSILVEFELDGYVNYTALAIRKDSSNVIRARFPTHGFSVSLVSTTDQDYDGTWLKAMTPRSGELLSKKEIRVLPNGISAVTNNWVLPGEGVAFTWSQKTAQPESVSHHMAG